MTGTPRDDLARFLRDELQAAADGRDDVVYEQVEAYVDGVLDDVDREIFETRLADDPGLRAMVEDLRALRPALAPTAAPARACRSNRAPRPSPPGPRPPTKPRLDAGGCRRASPRRQRWRCSCGGPGRRPPRCRRRRNSRRRRRSRGSRLAHPARPCRPVPYRRR